MAKIGSRPRLRDEIEALQAKDLKSVEIPWLFSAPPGITTLTLMATFRPQSTYFLTSIRYTMAVNGGWMVGMKIGFSPSPVAYQSAGTVGVTLLSALAPADGTAVSINTQKDFVNWDPYGWYLDVDDTINVLIECSMYPTNLGNVNQEGLVQLYLLETFEQTS